VLICFAGDAWDGNPHSRHHLTRRLAGEFEVLFVESVPMRGLVVGDRADWRRGLAKLRTMRPRLRTVARGLHVMRPPFVPPLGAVGLMTQTVTVRQAIVSALRRLRLVGPRVLWFSQPTAAPLLGKLDESVAMLFYQDRYDAFSHVDAGRLRQMLSDLARGADVAVATSHHLAEDLRRLGADPLVIPHGVELERFQEPGPTPTDIARLQRPIVGCVGLIDDYWDLEGLRLLADRLKTGSVVIVGAANTPVARLDHPRVHLLGPRPYEAVPAYLAAFDCCVIPFLVNRLTEAVNPIKLREYLAAGRPVVATPLPEVVPYGDVVRVAEPGEAFVSAVLSELEAAGDTEEDRSRRRARVAGESWDAAAAKISDLLYGLLQTT
jgi:glycosyltransferase involved in cell wall biosynthesis